jgi:mRNA-degrading endonuclease toxin of MazEF toxin-antitoxin module
MHCLGCARMGRLRSIVERLARTSAAHRRTPRAHRGGTPAGEGVRIVYAPDHDGDPDPGEVVWAWVPYEDDPSQGKDRPVLVIGYDAVGGGLVGVPLSSRDHRGRRDAGAWVEVGTGGWDGKGRTSYADADRVLRFPPDVVRREGASLPRHRFDAVVARARALGHVR